MATCDVAAVGTSMSTMDFVRNGSSGIPLVKYHTVGSASCAPSSHALSDIAAMVSQLGPSNPLIFRINMGLNFNGIACELDHDRPKYSSLGLRRLPHTLEI